MPPSISYQNQVLPVRICRRRGLRRLALSVAHDGTISLSAPPRVPLRFLTAFLERQGEWLRATLDRIGFSLEKVQSAKIEGEREYRALRDEARVLVTERLAFFNAHYRFSFRSISIRNQKTRWGSCSAAGRLSFNYRIALLPPHLQDYLVVHELAHVAEMNHSRAFWVLVAETIPNFAACRKELRRLPLSLKRSY